MKRAILCAALCASSYFAAAGAASAEEGQMRVRVADLNLATPAGAQVAMSRIRWSAAVFCEAAGGRQSLARETASQRCVSDMTRSSVTQLNAPLVTALLQGAPQAQPSAPLALAQK